jgi:hypothetical protein
MKTTIGLTLGLLITTMVVPAGSEKAAGPTNPIDYIKLALQESPIVCLSEGGHQAKEPHLLLRRILSDKDILTTLDVIIVEFASAQHQAVLDAYVRGEDVAFTELARVWRDTGQSPRAPWDSPLYHELLDVVRNGNRGLPPEKKVRVIAGDPAIDWEKIKTREDYQAARLPRDPYVAALAMEQAFRLGKRVLIIFGDAHLPRVPIAPGDPRNSLTYRILSQHPDAVTAIGFLIPENLDIEDRLVEAVPGMVYPTDRHWVGEINASLYFPELYSRVTDAKTGRQSGAKVQLYSEYSVRDLFDALVYIGPSNQWEHVPGSFDPKRDEAYLDELNRRSLIRFGRPMGHGG